MNRPTLRTRLCDIMGIEYPVISAGMGPSLIGEATGATVELVVAVSEAGGLGVLGAAGLTVEEMREAIRQAELTDSWEELRNRAIAEPSLLVDSS